MPIPGIALGAGLAGTFAGGLLGASEADKRRKKLMALANAPRTDVTGVEREGLKGNLENLDLAEALSRGVGLANTRVLSEVSEEGLPGFGQLRDSSMQQLMSLISGELPQDVQDAIQRSSAAQGVASGTSGSGFNRNLTMRDLGRTSLDAMTTGLGLLPSTLGALTPLTVGQPPNVQNQFISPEQRLQTEVQERALSLQMAAQAAGATTGKEIGAGLLGGLGGIATGAGLMGMMNVSSQNNADFNRLMSYNLQS